MNYFIYGMICFLGFGAVCDWFDRRNAPKKARNIGYRAAHKNKANAAFVARAQPVRRTEGVEVKPVATRPVQSAPAKKSQLELDVASTLVNLGYKKRDAARVISKAQEQVQGCDGFESLLKTALQIKI